VEPTTAVCKPEESEVVPVTIAVTVGEINSGDGLGNGHNLVARDVCFSRHLICVNRVKRSGINESVVGGSGKGWVMGDFEGFRGSDSEREMSFAVGAGC